MTVARHLAVAAVAALLAVTVPVERAEAHGGPQWSLSWLMSRIKGSRVSVGPWSGRVQIPSTLCSGEGRGGRWAGVRHWRHYTCTWTVFAPGSRGERDVTFRVP